MKIMRLEDIEIYEAVTGESILDDEPETTH